MKKSLALVATLALVVPTLSGCVQETASSTSEVVFVGMMGAPKVLDPAGTRSLEDAAILQQLFPSVMNSDGGAGEVVPEIAVSAEYASEFEYSVELKPDLSFSNGHALTASDVVHSINRIKSINDPNGPAVLIETIESVTAVGDTTVVFKPTRAFDQALPALLAGLPGLVVDEEVFPADRLLSNGEVAGSNAFAGPYTLAGYSEGSALRLNPNPAYAGLWGVPQNKGVEVRFYSSADQLMYDSSQMLIDVAIVHRQSLAASTGAATEAFAVDFIAGPNIETGMLLLNSSAGAFASPEGGNPKQSQDLREIFASLFDTRALIKDSFGSLYDPALGLVPDLFDGVGQRGKDSVAEPRGVISRLKSLGIQTPLQVEVSYPETLYGTSIGVLMDQVKKAIDETGAFEVALKPLSDSDYVAAGENGSYEVLFDLHYPLFADAEAFLGPAIAEAEDLGAASELIAEVRASYGEADTGEYRDHVSNNKRLEESLAKNAAYVPLYWGGRQALVRDGISGGDGLLGADGKLVLARLYRVLAG